MLKDSFEVRRKGCERVFAALDTCQYRYMSYFNSRNRILLNNVAHLEAMYEAQEQRLLHSGPRLCSCMLAWAGVNAVTTPGLGCAFLLAGPDWRGSAYEFHKASHSCNEFFISRLANKLTLLSMSAAADKVKTVGI
jgi:hypothetical protein